MSSQYRTLVTGGSGTLGQRIVSNLQDSNREVRATSRSPPADGEVDWTRLDLADATNIQDVVSGTEVLIHTASSPAGDTEAVDVAGTRTLLDAAARAGVSNFLYISIVGIEDIPYSYYEHKLAAEQLVEESEVPSTILRSTQFYTFLDNILSAIARLPLWPLPTKMLLQPIDADAVADRVVEHATVEASGRLAPIGGPEVLSVGDLAEIYREGRGTWRPIVRLPIPGAMFSSFRDGAATCPDHAAGTVRWDEWLADKYGTASSR